MQHIDRGDWTGRWIGAPIVGGPYSIPPAAYLRRDFSLDKKIASARLYATAAQAMDDGMVAIFDAKYHYNFWRPVTAIRNGDADGNDATAADAGWVSLIDAPLHPEYPSAHSILAGALWAGSTSSISSVDEVSRRRRRRS